MNNKDWKYCFIATICVVGQFLLPPLVHTFIVFLITVFLLQGTNGLLNKRMLFLITPFLFLMPIGLVGAWQWEAIDIFRDWWYVTNPILVLLAGGVFSQKTQGDISIILKAIVVASIIFSLLHIYQTYQYHAEWESMHEMDLENGWPLQKGSVVVAMAIATLLFTKARQFITWKREVRALAAFICITSLVLSGSRSWWLSFIILTGVFSLLKVRKIKPIFSLGLLFSIIALIFLALFPVTNLETCGGGFFCKVLNSVQELTPQYYFLNRDIAVYWRGYETYMAYQQYRDGSILQLIFGQGMGTFIQLDVVLSTGYDAVDKISIMHNGYGYTLVKFGVVGIFIYMTQCIRYLLLGLNAFDEDVYEQRLLGAFIVSLSVIILLLTAANGGFFNKRSFFPVLFFLGAFIRSRFYAMDKPNIK